MNCSSTIHASGIKPLKIAGDGYHAWTDAEIARFLAQHPAGSTARLAMLLALYTGQRRSDVVRMGWADIDDGFIKVKQEKTKAHLGIPIAAALAEALKDIPKDRATFLVSSHGDAFTGAGMGNWFRARCDEAEAASTAPCTAFARLLRVVSPRRAVPTARSWRSRATRPHKR